MHCTTQKWLAEVNKTVLQPSKQHNFLMGQQGRLFFFIGFYFQKLAKGSLTSMDRVLYEP